MILVLAPSLRWARVNMDFAGYDSDEWTYVNNIEDAYGHPRGTKYMVLCSLSDLPQKQRGILPAVASRYERDDSVERLQ